MKKLNIKPQFIKMINEVGEIESVEICSKRFYELINKKEYKPCNFIVCTNYKN